MSKKLFYQNFYLCVHVFIFHNIDKYLPKEIKIMQYHKCLNVTIIIIQSQCIRSINRKMDNFLICPTFRSSNKIIQFVFDKWDIEIPDF